MNAIVRGDLAGNNLRIVGGKAASDRPAANSSEPDAETALGALAKPDFSVTTAPGDGSDVAALKQRLAMLTRQLADEIVKISENGQTPQSTPEAIRLLLRHEIKARRLRERMLPEGLFADPAWDILLDLTLARLEGRQTPVSSLCIAAAVPTTTALRWIKTLLDRGLIERRPDPDDRRRHYIQVADDSFATMMAFMGKCADRAASIG